MPHFPRSIAIAGAWGYIGRKLLDAALSLGLEVSVHDPGPVPDDVNLDKVRLVDNEAAFYRLDADLFHLALHPEARARGLQILLGRAATEPILILNEKPMAAPEQPGECQQLIDTIRGSGAIMLFDFPELFDPLTQRITDYLAQFDDVTITDISLQRSKDREDPANPRNRKRMVPIQYQEAVHCLAYVLHLLRSLRGSIGEIFRDGLIVSATSEPYSPPNPEDYPHVVDGCCEYSLEFGALEIRGLADFKRNAPWSKRRLIRGAADGRPFTIEADYLEGEKYLKINGVDQDYPATASSYEAILTAMGQWHEDIKSENASRGFYPNADFARLTYQLSSVLWKSCYDGRPICLGSVADLISFNACYADERKNFMRYSRNGKPL